MRRQASAVSATFSSLQEWKSESQSPMLLCTKVLFPRSVTESDRPVGRSSECPQKFPQLLFVE